MSEKLTGHEWAPPTQDREFVEAYRARIHAQKRAEEARARRGMAVNLAGALGTDHPTVFLYVLALRAVSEASRSSAEYGAMANLCHKSSRLSLTLAEQHFDRDGVNGTKDLDRLREARQLTDEASRLYKEAEKAAEEVAQLSTEVELLESALLSRRDNESVLRYALASKALESLAAQVFHAAHTLEDFAPPSSRPRTRSTFAHAPPSFFATETEAPGRGVGTIHSTNQVRSQEPSF